MLQTKPQDRSNVGTSASNQRRLAEPDLGKAAARDKALVIYGYINIDYINILIY